MGRSWRLNRSCRHAARSVLSRCGSRHAAGCSAGRCARLTAWNQNLRQSARLARIVELETLYTHLQRTLANWIRPCSISSGRSNASSESARWRRSRPTGRSRRKCASPKTNAAALLVPRAAQRSLDASPRCVAQAQVRLAPAAALATQLQSSTSRRRTACAGSRCRPVECERRMMSGT